MPLDGNMIDTDKLALSLLARTERMKSARGIYNAHWQEVRDNVIPVLQRFIGHDPEGVKSNQFTVDETPEQANELLAAALHGMICNPALRYAEVGPRNKRLMESERVAAWFYHVNEIMFEFMYTPKSGLTAAHHETFLDTTSFGTGCLYTSERPGTGLHYACRELREIYIEEGADGRVDTVHRWFHLSARQAVQEFGEKKVTPKIRDKAASGTEQDKPMPFLHAVYPRSDGRIDALLPTNLPVASIYIAVDEKCVLQQSGFHEMPFSVPRWLKRPGEKYGRGPGTKALPSAKALQRTMKTTITAGEMKLAPPLAVADDGVLNTPRLHARGMTYVDREFMQAGKDAIKPIITDTDPGWGEEFMKGMRERIQASFYNHLLQMYRDPRMTATQVIQIAEETLRVLGPVIGRLQAELLGPSIERTFAILLRAGAFPPMPPELHGQETAIEYVSPIAQQQKLSEAKGIVQTFGVVAQMAQFDPSVMDNFDLDASSKALAIMFGMPRYLLRDPAQIAAKRIAAAKQQQQQQMLANAQAGANALKNAASALPDLRQGLGFGPDEPQGATSLAA